MLGLPALSKVLPPDSAQAPRPAVLHLHEALVGVGHVVGATDGVVLAGADAPAAGKHELEVLQALGDGGHVDVLAEKMQMFVRQNIDYSSVDSSFPSP